MGWPRDSEGSHSTTWFRRSQANVPQSVSQMPRNPHRTTQRHFSIRRAALGTERIVPRAHSARIVPALIKSG